MSFTLRPVLKSQDLMEGLTITSEQRDLAQQLLRVGGPDGQPVTEREALLAARLALSVSPVPSRFKAADSWAYFKLLRPFLDLPNLPETAEERTARWQAWRRPARWRKSLVLAVAFGSIGALILQHIMPDLGQAWWGLMRVSFRFGSLFVPSDLQHQAGPLFQDPVGFDPWLSLQTNLFMALGDLCLIKGASHLLQALFDDVDVPAYTERQIAAYRQSLTALSNEQLTQIHAFIQRQLPRHRAYYQTVHALILETLQARGAPMPADTAA